jgi:small ligand-binding sensory domain FIST
MTAFAAGLSEHPSSRDAIAEAAGQVLDAMDGEPAHLVVVFATPHHTPVFGDLVDLLRHAFEDAVVIGCTASGVVGTGREVEAGAGLVVWAASMPDARFTPVLLEVVEMDDGASIVGWPTTVPAGTALLLLADPFTFPADAFLTHLDDVLPGITVFGGIASAAERKGGNRLALDEVIATEGAVGILIDADVDIVTVVSQGCRPIGQPFVVTKADGNVLEELGGRPALSRLRDAVEETPEEERRLTGGLHIGRVVDEHKAEFVRGDFLVRNVLQAAPAEGTVTVGDVLEVGQTVQFHVRDAVCADEDLRSLLAGHRADAALVFTCNGRGHRLFGELDHDAAVVEELLGGIPVAGFFAAGELGSIGGRNFLHSYTASIALFAG